MKNKQLIKSKRKPSDPILAPLIKSPAKVGLERSKSEISHAVVKCGHSMDEVLFWELFIGLIWEIAKVKAMETARLKPGKDSGKDSPVAKLHQDLKAANPALKSARTLNSWGRGVLLGSQAEGWVKLPKKKGRKQPRPKQIELLATVSETNLKTLAAKYPTLSALNSTLKPTTRRSEKKSVTATALEKILSDAVAGLESQPLPAKCLPALLKLKKLVAAKLKQIKSAKVKSVKKGNKKL